MLLASHDGVVGNPAFLVAFIGSLTDAEGPIAQRQAVIACMYEVCDRLREVAHGTVQARKMINPGIEAGVVDGQLPGEYSPWGNDYAATMAPGGKLTGGVWGDQAEGEPTCYATRKDRYSNAAVRAFCLRLNRHGEPPSRLYTQYGHEPWSVFNGKRTGTVLPISRVRWKRGE